MNIKRDLLRNYFILICVLIQIAHTGGQDAPKLPFKENACSVEYDEDCQNRIKWLKESARLSLISLINSTQTTLDQFTNISSCASPNQTISQSYELNCYKGIPFSFTDGIFPGALNTITSVCNPGYSREDGRNVVQAYCLDKEWLPPIPECRKICKRLHPSEDVIVTCYYKGIEIRCNIPLYSGMEVYATCKPYRRRIDTHSENRMICENGQWSGTLPVCVLECGKIDGDDSSRMVFGSTYNYNHFPWHVAIYDTRSTPILICSGSIISPILIVTASACVKDILAVEFFEIIVAKVTPDYYFQDNEFQKSYKVHRIYTNDASGIAILEVVDEISFSYGVSPLCYTANTFSDKATREIINAGHWETNYQTFQNKLIFKSNLPGRVASWGIINRDNVHEANFRIDEYSTKEFEHCTSEEKKFCGQQTCKRDDLHGAGTNISDLGAGFVYYHPEKKRYFVIGVVNHKYRFQNNYVVICSNFEAEGTLEWMTITPQMATNQRVIDNAALNFKTKPDCEYEKDFDVRLQQALVCPTVMKNPYINFCMNTCDKLPQPQGMLLTCNFQNLVLECDQELIPGVIVSFRCVDGYKPKHQINYENIECQSNGKWSNQLPLCIRDDNTTSCALPPVTEDKTYTIDCDPNRKYNPSDEYVKELTMLAFQCNPGYYYKELAPENEDFFCEPNVHYKEKLNNFQVICVNGSWTPKIGNCYKLCKMFTSINLKPECYFNDKTISCNQPLLAGTRMRPSCQAYYRKKYHLDSEELTCNENGEWDGFPIECVPYCSTYENLYTDNRTFIPDKRSIEIWHHVSIMEKEIKSPICAGTLISPYLILTAARCFYNPTTKRLGNANRYEVIVGKKIKRLSSSLNEDVLKFANDKKAYQVKAIYYTNKGKTKILANYSEDLAVLETVQRIDLNSNTIPVCVNWDQSDEFGLTKYHTFADNEDAHPGKIAKWGGDYFEKDGTYIGSEILLGTYHHHEYSTCQQFTQNKLINNSDLFCAYKSDTNNEDIISKNHKLETSDYGSGFVQIKGYGDLYYLQGVFSSITANQSFYQVISTSYHIKWLNRIRLNVEKQRTYEESRKYFDVDSFRRKNVCQNVLSSVEFGTDPKLRISCNGSSINRYFPNGCYLPQRKLYNIDYEHTCPANVYENRCRAVGENESVPQLTTLNYRCLEGYAVPITGLTNDLVSFCKNGEWQSPIQKCKKYCKQLKPVNVKLTCYYNAAPVSCDGNLGQNTVVYPECMNEYEPESDPRYKEIICLPNGQWSDALYRCKPKCGKSASNVTTLIRGGGEARFGEFPWQVAIYDKTTNNTLICGGSIISPYVIVSAAHCFYDQQRRMVRPANSYVIAAGKISRDISKRDSEVTEFYEVEKIILENFLGITLRYQFDIAILQIKNKIAFNPQVIPICLRQSGTTIIPSGEILYVSGWGVDDTDEPSSTLRVSAIPYLSISECLRKVQDHLLGFISTDKFCVENINGSIVDSGDSGGGLSRVDKVSSLHYLVGIVSFRATNSPSVAIITDVTQGIYIKWISKQMNEIHRAKQYDI